MPFAISIRQPWASLILSGRKRFELRSWPLPGKFAGTWLLLHVSGTLGKAERNFCGMLGVRPGFQGFFIGEIMFGKPFRGNVPPGFASFLKGPECWFWPVAGAREIRPFPGKGRLGIFQEISCPCP